MEGYDKAGEGYISPHALMVHYGLILKIRYVFISDLAARRRGHSFESGVSLD